MYVRVGAVGCACPVGVIIPDGVWAGRRCCHMQSGPSLLNSWWAVGREGVRERGGGGEGTEVEFCCLKGMSRWRFVLIGRLSGRLLQQV